MDDQTLLGCGIVAGLVFTVVYLVEGALRPQYRPFRHPVSSLALGDRGWIQVANFLVAGLLASAFAIGAWDAGSSRVGALLLGVWAIGLLGAGAFRTDPVSGYPVGTPDKLERPSTFGVLHDGLSLAGFVALVAACFVYGVSGPVVWTVYSISSGLLFMGVMVMSSAAFGQNRRLVDVGGLLQRIAVTIGWAWVAVLALRIGHHAA